MASMLPWITWSCLLMGVPQTPAEKLSPGWGLWQQGQQALAHGQAEKAIDLFEESLASDPKLTRNYLSLAAAYLDRDDEGKACVYLMLYVADHPDQVAVRLQYADLLHRLKRVTEARRELECAIADVQEKPRPDEHLVQCHSKLMQIAEQMENEYEEHLHRGIGLYLLSRQHLDTSGDPDMLCPQGLLCKAAGELTLAARARPDEARPYYYLHEVWSRLLQSQPARKSLRAAVDAAPFSYLTPAEQRQLQLASRERERMTTRR